MPIERTRDISRSMVAVATSNTEKFNRLVEICPQVGITDVQFVQLSPPRDVPELVDRNAVLVGRDKLIGMTDAFEEKDTFAVLAESGIYLDYLLVMDVLPEADKRLKLPQAQAIMKKPHEGQTALEAFTEYFEVCLEAMKRENVERLHLSYNLIMAVAPINQQTRRVNREKIRVEWDEIHFTFSYALVEFLASAKSIKSLDSLGFELNELLSNESVSGMKIQALVPMIAELAAMDNTDKLTMWVSYTEGKYDQYLQSIDKPDDLTSEKCEVQVLRADDKVKLKRMTLGEFIKNSVKNVTPRLLKKIFLQPKRGTKGY